MKIVKRAACWTPLLLPVPSHCRPLFHWPRYLLHIHSLTHILHSYTLTLLNTLTHTLALTLLPIPPAEHTLIKLEKVPLKHTHSLVHSYTYKHALLISQIISRGSLVRHPCCKHIFITNIFKNVSAVPELGSVR